MFRFAHPEYLYLLIIIPLLVGFHIYSTIDKKKKLKSLGELDLLRLLMPLYSTKRQHVKFYLLLSAIIFLIFLIARPQFGAKIETEKRKGVEVIIALDVSNSMMATDLQPNRLEKSKQIVSKLMDEMVNDKVGLIVFAGDAYTQLPITSDYVSAKMFMPSINPSLVPLQGTAIGSAIETAMKSFSKKEKIGRTIIVITDGENHEDNAVEAAKEAYKKGITTHVIGVGSPEGSPIPIDESLNFKRDKDGNIVVSKLNIAMCKEIAEAGKGIYVVADNTNNALKTVQQEIDKIAKAEFESNIYSEYSEQFQFVGLLVLILLLVEFFFMERKNKLYSKIKLI